MVMGQGTAHDLITFSFLEIQDLLHHAKSCWLQATKCNQIVGQFSLVIPGLGMSWHDMSPKVI